jgi:Kef-type K+ transport system membrane component KefB
MPLSITPNRRLAAALVLLLCLAAPALAAGGEYSDPVAPILLELALLLAAAKLGASAFLRLGQPAVLGELVAGIVLGNLLLAGGDQTVGGWMVAQAVTPGLPLDILARLGLVLLLFVVGLECDLRAMWRMSGPALAVSSFGVAATFVLTWGAAALLAPGGAEPLRAVFIAVALCATSVGVTARVLRELGVLERDEAAIILGAAVLDDLMGLVLLAVVAALATAREAGTALAGGDVALMFAAATTFLVLAVAGGAWLAPRAFALTSRLRGEGLLLLTALGLCFVLAGLSAAVGLAPMIGAFAAGLLLEEVHYVEFRRRHGVDRKLEDLLQPLAEFLVPIFFVQMGLTVRLAAVAQPRALLFALVLGLAAVAGKLACGLGAPRRCRRLAVGVGMAPRGEVVIIAAAMGRGLTLGGRPLIDDVANAAIVLVVVGSTLITPPLLAACWRREPTANP